MDGLRSRSSIDRLQAREVVRKHLAVQPDEAGCREEYTIPRAASESEDPVLGCETAWEAA